MTGEEPDEVGGRGDLVAPTESGRGDPGLVDLKNAGKSVSIVE